MFLSMRESGGSSTSAPASSSNKGGTLADCEDHARAVAGKDECLSESMMSLKGKANYRIDCSESGVVE